MHTFNPIRPSIKTFTARKDSVKTSEEKTGHLFTRTSLLSQDKSKIKTAERPSKR